jgi:arylsulfate sulfotransferase
MIRFSQLSFILTIVTSLLFFGCETGPQPLDKLLEREIQVKLNPHEKVPLGAMLNFTSKEKCTVKIEILGEIPIERSFAEARRFHEVPVIGLYPDTLNSILITLTTNKGKTYTGEVQIRTGPVPEFFPDIEIAKIEKSQMEPGFHLIEMLIANNGKFLPYTIMFDDQGKIRWFMDMSSLGQIAFSAYRLRNGNWLYLSWIGIFEMDPLGKLIKQEQMWGNAGSHEIIELDNGHLLMGGSKKDSKIIRDGREINSRFDFVVEWDREGLGRTVREWDLRAVLDVDRSVFPADYSLDFSADWFHINSVARSTNDNSIVVSGRNQGVVKVDYNNQPKWILAPHRSWGKAGFDGNGHETADYLLTAVDENEDAYSALVQEGIQGEETFEWSTGQHALTVLENGNLLLFDNGLMRNFKSDPSYSRAVEYKIDESNMTIQQVWEYGKDRKLDMFSPITSDVDVLPGTGNRLITAGTIRKSALAPHAKLIEVTYPDNREVFEALIFFKDALGTGAQVWAQFDLVFRGERYPLF